LKQREGVRKDTFFNAFLQDEKGGRFYRVAGLCPFPSGKTFGPFFEITLLFRIRPKGFLNGLVRAYFVIGGGEENTSLPALSCGRFE
jgi:hypothetical protein